MFEKPYFELTFTCALVTSERHLKIPVMLRAWHVEQHLTAMKAPVASWACFRAEGRTGSVPGIGLALPFSKSWHSTANVTEIAPETG